MAERDGLAAGTGTPAAEPKPRPLPQRVQVAADTSQARPAVGVLFALAAIVIVPWGARHLYRRRHPRRRRRA
jgi:hypothetical protein